MRHIPREREKSSCPRCETGRVQPASKLPAMGFNPFRKQERRAADLAMVVGAIAVTAALVAWAFLGG